MQKTMAKHTGGLPKNSSIVNCRDCVTVPFLLSGLGRLSRVCKVRKNLVDHLACINCRQVGVSTSWPRTVGSVDMFGMSTTWFVDQMTCIIDGVFPPKKNKKTAKNESYEVICTYHLIFALVDGSASG